MKRFLTCLLAAAMLLSLAACAGTSPGLPAGEEPEDTGNGEAAAQPITSSGRYVETGITPEELSADPDTFAYGSRFWAREDGSLDLLVYTAKRNGEDEGRFWYHSDDKGDSWTARELPDWDAIDWIIDSQGNLYAFGCGEDGTLLEYYQMADGTDGQRTVDLGGVRLSNGLSLTGESEAENAVYLTGDTGRYQDKLFLLSIENENGPQTLYAIDLSSGELLWTYTPAEKGRLRWTGVGDTLYVTAEDQTSLNAVLDAATGKQISSFDLNTLHASLNAVQATEQGAYYYLSDNGDFCRGIFGSEQTEVILDANEYRYGAEGTSFGWSGDQFGVMEDGTLFVNAINDNAGVNLYRYDFDTNAASREGTLTIWSLEEQSTVRQAILAFQERHPEVRVDYQVPDLDEGSQTINDVLTSLNTKMLAGKGPDVLILDGVGYETYQARGVLADLTDLYESTEFVGQTVSALLDGSGKCYVIPARFTVPVLMGREQNVSASLEALVQAAASGGTEVRQSSFEVDEEGNYHMVPNQQEEWEKPYFSMDFELLENILWRSSASGLIRQNSVQEDGLRQWLETLKEICDHFGYFELDEDGYGILSVASGPSLGYGNQNVRMDEPALQWSQGNTQTASMTLNAVEELVAALDSAGELGTSTEGFSVAQFPGLIEGAYTPEILMGVSEASEQRELAKEFVACALSMQVQQYTYGDGLPVLREAMDGQLDYFASYTEKYGWEIQQLNTLFDSRTAPVVTNLQEREVIDEAAKAYCKGTISLDEAVNTVKDGLALKLAEQ